MISHFDLYSFYCVTKIIKELIRQGPRYLYNLMSLHMLNWPGS